MAKAKSKKAPKKKAAAKQGNVWDKYPEKELAHLENNPEVFQRMQRRRRHRHVRYWCFRLKTLFDLMAKGEEVQLSDPEKQPGFIEFWLEQKPAYAIDPKGQRVEVPKGKRITVQDLGGYTSFAIVWDVDDDLEVYIRHSSVWHEWNLTLLRVVPFLGDV